MMKKLRTFEEVLMMKKLNTYIVEFQGADGDPRYSYIEAEDVQSAVDFAREGAEDGYVVVEVSRVVKGWR